MYDIQDITGYYRDFILGFASHSYHLTEFTKKTAPDNVQWTNSLDSEYSYLQSCLCSLPSLYIPILGDVLYLQTNASGVGVGAVLSIRHDSRELPAVYYSRKLTQQNGTILRRN